MLNRNHFYIYLTYSKEDGQIKHKELALNKSREQHFGGKT